MKRKKTVPAEVVPKPVNDAAPVPEKDHPLYDRLFVVGFAVLLFFAMTVQTVPMSLILAAVALALSFGRGGYARFRGRLGIPVLGFLAFLILCGAASLYTSFGAYAYGEYAKLLASGALGLLLLARGREQNAGGLLFGFSAVCGVIGLLCIDAGCRGPLFRGFASFMEGLGDAAYQSLDQATYTGARFDGIYNDANLTGSLMALAVLVGLYLIRTGRKPWERFAACFLTGLSAVAFFTAMSRGAILCFGATLLAYLLIAGKEERLGLFFTMAAMGISMVVFGVVSTSLLAGGSFWGTLAALPSGVLLWLLNEFPARKAASALAGHGKLLAGVLGGGIAAGIAAVVLALTLTEPFVFTESNFLYRGADVEGGETYTFSGDWDKSSEITVLVYGSTREQELTSVTETYYNGPLEEASFTVPEDVGHVLMQFRGPAGLELRQVSLSDGTEIPMAYTLLPDNIANRLQKNIFEDSSFLLRLQYDIDGWTLFKESPLAGHGLGATEGLLTSVQPFFYESLYLHTHLLQVMDETGLLGLAAFLAFILGTAVLLVRQLRKARTPLAAMLLACLVMMNLHGLMEISFSVQMFQCAAFFLLLLPTVCYGTYTEGRKRRAAGIVVLVVSDLWLVISVALLGGSLLAQKEYRELDAAGMTTGSFIETLERLDRMDAYNDQSYKVNLMGNALQAGGISNEGTAARCARELRETGEFDSCYYVAAYYYLPLGQLENFFDVLQEGLLQERSNSEAWNSAMNLCIQAFSQIDPAEADTFAEGVRGIGEAMDRANAYLLVPVALTEENAALLNCARTDLLDGEGMYAAISQVLSQAGNPS
ncbi:O-antigen ligase family protein [Oscillibacter sp. KLE 1728]|uniref:O-antigen ligase family protein n=1 Tax=Oscillibacter sp. KLE 1728 TaxID=1226322 RepID=UPI0025910759|nr:O-antigen ligase family protein [Oscillibacter sp. KLE 1728]